MDLGKLAQSVKSEHYALKQRENNSKNAYTCWETFRDIFDDRDNLVFGAGCCSLCYVCIIYKKHEGDEVIDFRDKKSTRFLRLAK